MSREAKFADREIDAQSGSERLLLRMEQQFAMFSRAYGIDYLDARSWLMDRKRAS